MPETNRFYSLIIPVYNRPDEVDELLESLTKQTYTNFEVLVIEDGSSLPCDDVVSRYTLSLDIRYFAKENEGQGFTRNYAYERASGDYFIVFDSDCIIPSHYLETVNSHLNTEWLDAFGGPDKSHESFTDVQKAISYSMTSPYTTGGIRGSKKHAGTFHPRSFNMGISAEVWKKTKGYVITRMGEDIEFSIRIINSGFKVGLIEDAYVYHKRRTDFRQFYKQLFFFGRARVNIGRFYSSEIKFFHLFPVCFFLGFLFWLLILPWLMPGLFIFGAGMLLGYYMLIFFDSFFKNGKSLSIASKSLIASFIQLFAYGHGFVSEWLKFIKEPYSG
ncbi:glycosyltransferase [Marinigracilibium pacificum]|uniref:Glycosyltransferase n=1 Tax=Marinigracilibium pacificum TaxID=2729599 RepID=A0A848J3G1_9BACT|nr:glycosyltransferase [Marinigracilibium pacificum]NMM50276.1 glycosyltransferase [Marinigracilibium pacificum]